MNNRKAVAPIDKAASALRELALAAPVGELIGSEDEIVERLGVSRVTARQSARLLEREGVLLVKRGKKGGYFAARPSFEMVEEVVCAYLDTLGIDAAHTSGVSTALWVEAVREATVSDRTTAGKTAALLRELIEQVPESAAMALISQAEAEFRSLVLDQIDGDYLRMILQINAAFARTKMPRTGSPVDPIAHIEFVRKWRSAKLLQAEAIASGDTLQGVLAAFHERRAWEDRWIASGDFKPPSGSQG